VDFIPLPALNATSLRDALASAGLLFDPVVAQFLTRSGLADWRSRTGLAVYRTRTDFGRVPYPQSGGLRIHPFMAQGQPFDLYQDLGAELGLYVPQPYIDAPTLDNLRTMLIAAGVIAHGSQPLPPDPPFTLPPPILRYGDVIFQER
jgi:hypothetical protein